MHERGKSDSFVVPGKSANEPSGAPRGEERTEGRGLAEGNSQQRNRNRTQCRARLQQSLERVRQAALRDKTQKLTALWHHVYDVDRLRESYFTLKKDAAAGIDGETWRSYGANLEENLHDLAERLRRGAYRAAAVRRTYIPKADGRQRPIGIPTLEDKLVQRTAAEVMGTVYEADFEGFSYGFRPGRSQHDALDALSVGIEGRGVSWILDADIRGFFDTIDHGWLMKFIEHRIADPRVHRHVRKWLKAGVLEDGRWTQAEEGTPQGGSISPLLANIYLHYVLDLWVDAWRKKVARGEVIVVRYADDCAPRRRGKEAERPPESSLAAQEMRAGPSDSDCRVRVQTTGSCSGPMAGVVSVSEKAGCTRQVSAGKTNVSEPLMTCRKRRDVIETGLQLLARDEAQGKPVDCLSGDRHEDGVSPAQALVRNVGTFSLDAKGDLQVVVP